MECAEFRVKIFPFFLHKYKSCLLLSVCLKRRHFYLIMLRRSLHCVICSFRLLGVICPYYRNHLSEERFVLSESADYILLCLLFHLFFFFLPLSISISGVKIFYVVFYPDRERGLQLTFPPPVRIFKSPEKYTFQYNPGTPTGSFFKIPEPIH